MVLGSIALLIVLIALTVNTVSSGGSGRGAAAGSAATTPAQTPPETPHATPTSSSAGRSTASSTGDSSATGPVSSSAAPLPCVAKDLSVTAVVGQSAYKVGDQPLLELQVTNTGSKPCVQDLADRQVELRVYNGESRVWGSHDCQIQPGTDLRTLAVSQPVRVAINWSGLSSQPNCAGTRQRVGAGTYTLYALLSGRTGRAVQFTIS
jgi:hypothetical protein